MAGGQSRRMGGVDKATIVLDGVRLIDRVIARLRPQVDEILIAGAGEYDTGLKALADREDGPRGGPAAALWSSVHWLTERMPGVEGFLTAPVDGPFLPPDLYARLSKAGGCAIACDEAGDHPTFAYWNADALLKALRSAAAGGSAALHDIAALCDAARVSFGDSSDLLNVNAPEDLKAAEAVLNGV